ncbi:MAG: ABC transporter ATP-binding protein [Planctomycetes bacterium]|nr:ABC transporter ATP-binding protein [Planctomycetota bacterium]
MSENAIDNSVGIRARGLVKYYEAGQVHAVDAVDLDVVAGEFVAICGPSGCGKTTLLHLFSAIERPDTGSLNVAGCALTEMSEAEIDTFRRTVVGLVFQLHNLLPDLTALENVQVPMFGTDRSARERLRRARELVERVGLTDRAHARPTVLSGGERQRVAIARALANEPRVLLADEPTGALDSKNGELLLDLLDELQRDARTTLIVVTHDQHIAERAGRVLHMLDGRITDSAQPDAAVSGSA